MRGRLAALALAAGLTLTGCGAQENGVPPEFIPEEGERLVVYTSHKEEVYWPIVKEFEERTGIWVEVVPGGTNELLARLVAESDQPAADVMFGGGVDSLAAYQRASPLTSAPAGTAWTRPCGRRTGCGLPSPPCLWCSSTTPSWWSRGR